MRHSRTLPVLLGVSALFSACDRRPTKEVTITMDLMIKHCYRSYERDGWRAEVWLTGSSQPAWYPVDVLVRLSPKDTKAPLPAVQAELTIYQVKGDQERKAKLALNLVFQECATMRPRKEYIYEDESGPAVLFPPKHRCWEAFISDPFRSDRRKKGTSPLAAGKYVLKGRIILAPGPVFDIELPALEAFIGKGGSTVD